MTDVLLPSEGRDNLQATVNKKVVQTHDGADAATGRRQLKCWQYSKIISSVAARKIAMAARSTQI